LVEHREAIAKNPPLRHRGEKYWGKPLAGFGDPNAQIYIVGLAPAANGGNRTGRIFTGDRSGDWLFGMLYEIGFANQKESISRDDGLQLTHTYIGAAARCAPPGNKPTPQEFANCYPYLETEFALLKKVRVVIALGSLAYGSVKKLLQPAFPDYRWPPFGHGQKAVLPDGRAVICSYHPSQQNTFTGKLTHEMFKRVFMEAKKMVH